MIPLLKSIGERCERKLWRSLLLIPLAVGCTTQVDHESGAFHSSYEGTVGRPVPQEYKMLFRYQVHDGEAALENERVVLVFHGLSPEQQRLFHFPHDQQAVQIDGPGKYHVSTTCGSGKDKVTFRSDYARGTNTLQFGAQRVRLTRRGWLLLAGEQSVDLSEGRKIIHLKGDNLTVE